MPRISYVNGRYRPHRSAVVHIEDRGYQFADGVYEVIAVRDGVPGALEQHLSRLARSLSELGIRPPMSERALRHVFGRVIALNRLRNGTLYAQITRGVASRDHAFAVGMQSQFVVTTKRAKPADPRHLEEGVRIISIPDERWARRDIKSISLLPNVLGKQRARGQGAYEAWQVDEQGFVTEGTSSNAWIVTADGEIVTTPAGNAILSGITRLNVFAAARAADMRVIERRFTLEEAKRAREAFLTSTTSFVQPVTQIDEQVIGNGRPGSISMSLRTLLIDRLTSWPETAHKPDAP